MRKEISRVAEMPDFPQPFGMRDWKQVTRDYDTLCFDFGRKGDFLPIIWLDEQNDSFGMHSYISAKPKGPRHESITCMASVVGAGLAGIDKRSQEYDFVRMCECYFGEKNGVVLNFPENVGGHAGGSMWYDGYANVTFYLLNHLFPGHGRLPEYMRRSADKWFEVVRQLSGDFKYTPNFNFTGYRFSEMRPFHNGRWIEPEGAAGAGWLLGIAHAVYGDQKFLDGARCALSFLDENKGNPTYEILMPYGAQIAARLNAEQGDSHDVGKYIDWFMSGTSYSRHGWGVIAENWGGYDCHGLVGSITDDGLSGIDLPAAFKKEHAGYAFVTNTYSMVAAILPIARYDKRYARDIAKLILNTANASRLYYPGAWDARHQSCEFWHGDPYNCLAYEGLRKKYDGKSPYATGDPIRFGWGSMDIGMYGSSHVGYMAGCIDLTDVEGILRLDCLKSDAFHAPALPTYLYFNPHGEEKCVTVPVSGACDIYDTLSETFLSTNQQGDYSLRLPSKGAAQLVLVPHDGTGFRAGKGRLYKGETIVDYMRETPL